MSNLQIYPWIGVDPQLEPLCKTTELDIP